MRRHDYLQLRAEQCDLILGVHHWDTCPLPEMKRIEAVLTRRLASDEALLTKSWTVNGRVQSEYQVQVNYSRRLLLYLRALQYLREQGIAPDWPRGSVPAPR
jgi:hypothetical protein